MFDDLVSPQVLVYAAGACHVRGFLLINQITLRLRVLLGTGFYLIYYATVSDTRLWKANYISVLIAVANIIGLPSPTARQSHLAMPTRGDQHNLGAGQ